MKKTMSYDVAEHFYAWLEKTVSPCEQHEVEEQIHALLRENPDLIEKGYSWLEMRKMAEVTT
jgi:RecB family endonuclease NucS